MRKIHIRVAMVYITAAILFLIIRSFVVPPTFGEYDWYRGDSVREIMELPPQHANATACKDCHSERYDLWSGGAHSTVSCESCHGPSYAHTKDPIIVSADIDNSREFCGLCHAQNPSRPEGFPQIDMDTHGNGNLCVVCHNPHSPWVFGGE
jgi:hypothetical protein